MKTSWMNIYSSFHPMTHGTEIFLYIFECKNSALTSLNMTIVTFLTKIHAISSSEMCYMGGVSTPSSDDVSPMKKQIKCSMIVTVEHVEVTFLACPLQKISLGWVLLAQHIP
jgi:hypothetical protein